MIGGDERASYKGRTRYLTVEILTSIRDPSSLTSRRWLVTVLALAGCTAIFPFSPRMEDGAVADGGTDTDADTDTDTDSELPTNPFCSGDTCFVARGQLITSDLRTYVESKYSTRSSAQAWATNCSDGQTYDTRAGGYTWLGGKYSNGVDTVFFSSANGWLQQLINSDNGVFILDAGWDRFKYFSVNTNAECDLRINWQ